MAPFASGATKWIWIIISRSAWVREKCGTAAASRMRAHTCTRYFVPPRVSACAWSTSDFARPRTNRESPRARIHAENVEIYVHMYYNVECFISSRADFRSRHNSCSALSSAWELGREKETLNFSTIFVETSLQQARDFCQRLKNIFCLSIAYYMRCDRIIFSVNENVFRTRSAFVSMPRSCKRSKEIKR